MTNGSNTIAGDWLLCDSPGPINESDWPWTRITKEQFSYLTTLRSETWQNTGNLLVVYSLCPFGVLGNLLIILALLRRKKNESITTFDLSMLGVAFLDLVFVVIKFPYAYIGTVAEHRTIFQWTAAGVVYFCSMMADLIILCLTIDRYISVTFPVEYNANSRKRTVAWRIGILVSFLLSATRFHYWINDVLACSTGPERNQFMCNLKYGLNYFADTVAPFAYMLIMCVLIALILRALWRRHRKVGQISSNTQADKAFAKFRRNFALLIIMFSMYVLNQLGYIIYSIAFVYFGYMRVDFDSSFEEAEAYLRAKEIYAYSNIANNFMEVFSRALTFYPYVIFSGSFRGYLVGLFKAGGAVNQPEVSGGTVQAIEVKPAGS